MAERLLIDRKNPDPAIIDRAVEALRDGGVIIYPTDTIYGLGCDIENRDAIERIYKIKGRDAGKPMSFICDDLTCVARYGIVSDKAYKVMRRTLPGPYTYLLHATKETPKLLQQKKKKTVGIRIPASAVSLALVKKLGRPIITTSVNVAGEEVLSSPKQMDELFGTEVDIILDAGAFSTEPSTIVDWSNDAPVVVRAGKGSTKYFT
ncbi:MAG: L-threonylcarbamoyladenylate synthase [bacterium]|nr:L-threonylcarbamoyladenylate synthase [bacterium]